MSELWIRFRESLAKRGLIHTLESVISVPQDYLFDILNGTDTARRIRQTALAVVSEHAEGARDYIPTRGRAFNKLMRRIGFPEGSVFIDFGSGKGKILLLASRLGFRRVIGVEFSAKLCAFAKQNVDVYRSKILVGNEVEVVCTDAAQYPIPDDANVFFMFNPFGMSVMETVADNIKISLNRKQRSIWMIYNDPVYVEAVKRQLKLREVMTYTYGGHDFIVISNDWSDTRTH
jgi:SAM-dependent methyltransferase